MEEADDARRGAEGGGSGAEGRTGRDRARAAGARRRTRALEQATCSARPTSATAIAAQVSRRRAGAVRARRARPQGLAVAEARDGLCTVCHVRLRPQIFNEVRRNDSIIQCDSCTRILYFVPAAAAGRAASAVLIRDGSSRTSTAGPAAIPARRATASASKSPTAPLIDELYGGLGIATNNVAEYNGLLAALQWAVDHGHAACRSAPIPSCSSSRCAANTRSSTPACSRS